MIDRGSENGTRRRWRTPSPGTGVYEAVVLGVPGEMMGEKVGAVIVVVPGTELDMVAVSGHLATHIGGFKIPRYVAVSTPPRRAVPAASCSSASFARTLTGPAAARCWPASARPLVGS